MTEYGEKDMAEAHKLVRLFCAHRSIIPDDDLLQVGAIGLWEAKQWAARRGVELSRTLKSKFVVRAVIREIRLRLGRDGRKPRAQADGHQFLVAGSGPSPYEAAEARDLLEVAKRVLRGTMRKVIDRVLAEESYERIASEVGVTSRSATVYKSVAVQRMRDRLGVKK